MEMILQNMRVEKVSDCEIEAKRFIENVLEKFLTQSGKTFRVDSRDGVITSKETEEIADYGVAAVAKAFSLAKHYGICSEMRMGREHGCSYLFWKGNK